MQTAEVVVKVAEELIDASVSCTSEVIDAAIYRSCERLKTNNVPTPLATLGDYMFGFVTNYVVDHSSQRTMFGAASGRWSVQDVNAVGVRVVETAGIANEYARLRQVEKALLAMELGPLTLYDMDHGIGSLGARLLHFRDVLKVRGMVAAGAK